MIAAHGFRPIRWLAASGLLIACGIGLLNSSFEVCKVETKIEKGVTTETKTCDGPTVTDAGVVTVAFLIVLLLAPDMSEVGIFGVSLKRRLEAAEQKASASEAKADRLESQLQIQNLRVDTLSQNVVAATSQATNNVYLVSSDEMKKIDSELREKADAISRGEGPTLNDLQRPKTDEHGLDPVLSSLLIRNWEILAASLDLPPRRGGARSEVPRVKVSAGDIEEFTSLFDEEIQVVRAARNTVAHAGSISNDDLRTAVDISEQLLRILRTPRTR